MTESTIRLGIITPNMALRAGLRLFLGAAHVSEPAGPALQVIAEAASLADFSTSSTQVDVLIVSGEAFSVAGFQRATLESKEQIALLLLTDDPQAARHLLLATPLRACGILSTDCSAEELQTAVRAVQEGLLVGSPSLLQHLFKFSRQLQSGDPDHLGEAGMPAEALTDRESQVLQLLARGLANKQIAAVLRISEHTVKFHISSIYNKLGTTNRAEAVRTGIQRGLIIL
jgi:NarL family two-component system response regulator YdfI